MSKFVKSLENIVLRVIQFVRVKYLEGTLIEICFLKAKIVTLNRGLTKSRLIVFLKTEYIIFKESLHIFSTSRVYFSFLKIFHLYSKFISSHRSLSISSVQVYFRSQIWTVLEHVCWTVTEEAELSVYSLITVEYFLILHHHK